MPIPSTPADAAALLGVGLTADRDTIRDRYRRLARIYHPDANPDDDAAGVRMLELNAAVDLLLGADTPTVDPITEEAPRRSLTRREQRHEARIRDALHHLPYGVYVIGTATPDGEPNAMVADWVMQVSFSPRIVCISFERDATSLRNLRETRQLTDQSAAGVGHGPGRSLPATVRPIQDPGPFAPTVRGAGQDARRQIRAARRRRIPCWDDSLMWLAAEAQQFIPVGEHVLALCRSFDGDVHLRSTKDHSLTLYTGWHYGG